MLPLPQGMATWTSTTSMSTARYLLGGAGTQPLGLAFGGLHTTGSAATEEWAGAGSPETKTITTA